MQKCTLVHKAIHGDTPGYLQNIFKKNKSIHSYETRTSDKIHVVRHKTGCYAKSSEVSGAYVNAAPILPFSIKSSQ